MRNIACYILNEYFAVKGMIAIPLGDLNVNITDLLFCQLFYYHFFPAEFLILSIGKLLGVLT